MVWPCLAGWCFTEGLPRCTFSPGTELSKKITMTFYDFSGLCSAIQFAPLRLHACIFMCTLQWCFCVEFAKHYFCAYCNFCTLVSLVCIIQWFVPCSKSKKLVRRKYLYKYFAFSPHTRFCNVRRQVRLMVIIQMLFLQFVLRHALTSASIVSFVPMVAWKGIPMP